ncbi:uncharacterized protein B0J16DRAFT_340467 [Fusarium flagelliforme]|uniref:uncharacterized protein n=1 Tax=Fusarium flagelliforme TaxID=2675880 RepID=UPI001E8DD2A0|nr:uncharacterized protein B0J16DRAFT_340467 [Fusarium flagelliforme]KAH7184789.1 hypothetical protein B0J16DRAFT_340467 [Fusarium flagelliforme]
MVSKKKRACARNIPQQIPLRPDPFLDYFAWVGQIETDSRTEDRSPFPEFSFENLESYDNERYLEWLFSTPWTVHLGVNVNYSRVRNDSTPARAWRPSTDFSGPKDYRVQSSIGNHQVNALADTGAQSNFISAQFVKKVGLVPDDRNSRRIQLPGGKQVLSPGTVKVPFSFARELEEYQLDCWIIPGCTSDLILSGTFLRATETLTKFKKRVKETLSQTKQTCLRLRLLGNERQRIFGSLNGRPALALPDTGSDVMLVSTEWAKENKLGIDSSSQNRLELELADGSRVFTTGVVRNATWTFGDSAQSVSCDLYVLNSLSVDVVLSNSFIFELDVFSKFSHFMVNLDSMPDLSEFYNVRLISKYSAELARLENESVNDMSSPHARKAERVRRDRIRDAINALNVAQQTEAWEAESQRRLIWDRHYQYSAQTLPQVESQDSSNFRPRWWERTLEWWSEGRSIRRGAKVPNA